MIKMELGSVVNCRAMFSENQGLLEASSPSALELTASGCGDCLSQTGGGILKKWRGLLGLHVLAEGLKMR